MVKVSILIYNNLFKEMCDVSDIIAIYCMSMRGIII